LRQSAQQALQAHAARSQSGILGEARSLQARGEIDSITPFWIFNGLSVEAGASAIRALAARPDVLQITPDPDPDFPLAPTDLSSQEIAQHPGRGGLGDEVLPAGVIQPNIALSNAPAVWALGYTGQGVVAAILDTGVDGTHPDLAPGWRGGSNSWLDPYGEHATPYDANGHGTHVMGILAGGASDPAAGAIGMAPGVKWIAAKIFNDSGGYSEAAVHISFQWALDPDGNPATPDGADLVNNSWGYTTSGRCQLNFQVDIQNLRAAGVLPIFSSGNGGLSGSATDRSPGNNPGAFGVGGIDNNSQLYILSSGGPSTCDAALPYPRLVAPGVSILSAAPGTPRYELLSGTSMSSPHAAGALALLLSAFPDLPLSLQELALTRSAVDLGAPGFDFSFGAGRLDALAAYQWAKAVWGAPFKMYFPLLRRPFYYYLPVIHFPLSIFD
jgi:subtilisin family serine protease